MNNLVKKTKVIFIFGGVYSSLGKGTIISSIGKILTNNTKRVSVLKFDPYLNVNAGLISPSQHGEDFVTKDGIETDLDLGNYERFIEKELTKLSTVTSGRIYKEIIDCELSGGYKGKTIQVIPHVTNKIKEKIYNIINFEQPDFLLIEIGGTVGDAEWVPFTEAISQFIPEYGSENVLPILVSPLISLGSTNGELKTKPTQHSIKEIRTYGVFPNFLILRTSIKPDDEIYEKLELSSHIDRRNIFFSPDLKSIYDLPDILYKQKIHLRIFDYFNIKYIKDKDLFNKNWSSFMKKVNNIKKSIQIAIIGKYVSLHDAYVSLFEALRFAGYHANVNVNIKWIPANTVKTNNIAKLLKGCRGVVIDEVEGFGNNGDENIILAINYIRKNNIPMIAIGSGMQLMCIEFARNVLGIKSANSAEFSKTDDIIERINEGVLLGNHECTIEPKSTAFKLYKTNKINHRHANAYGMIDQKIISNFNKNGLNISMRMKKGNKIVAEFVENKKLKCYLGCQFHPEYHSKPKNVDPLFTYFIQHCFDK